jgi:hypothetical protein
MTWRIDMALDVVRFDFDLGVNGCLSLSPDGDYVRWADYREQRLRVIELECLIKEHKKAMSGQGEAADRLLWSAL